MEQTYFQRALSDFVFDMASGGAICHLTDLGYTVKQIQDKLDFPTPYERIQKAVWKHLLDTGVIVPQQPRLLCRFGLLKYKDPERYREVLGTLEPRQAEYIDGLPWGLESVWHRADRRMLEIYHTLEKAGVSGEVCFFKDSSAME